MKNLFNMERWYSVVNQRFSVRKYAGDPSEEDLQALKGCADMLSTMGVRIVIGKGAEVFSPLFLGFGKVKGTTIFAAFVSSAGKNEMVGYMGEAFILECTALGLGTCWLGGSFSGKAVEKLIPFSEGEEVVCIASIGIPAEGYTMRPRKSLAKLTGLGQEALVNLPEWQQRALECARMAPSAVNGQPWQFRVEKESIAVKNTSSNYGYGRLDCGIAMLHVELGAAHAGVSGEWDLTGDDRVFIPTGYDQ